MEIDVHKGYNPITIENDIAVLVLNLTEPTKDFRMRNGTRVEDNIIQPISMTRRNIPVDSRCQVSGWGATRLVSINYFGY